VASLLIGADIGTSALKAVLVDPAIGVLAVTERPYPMYRPHPGWAENDPADWFDAVVAAVGDLLTSAGVPGGDVAGLCVVGQRDPVVLLDARRRVLAPTIHWTDRRDPAGTAAIFEDVGRERIIEVSGVVPTAGLVLANLDWTRRHLSEAWAATRHAVQPKDYVLQRLTGILATDASSLSRSLLNDWRTDDWSPQLCDAAGIDVRILPPVRFGSWEPVGTLTTEAAALLGLPASTVVAAGGGDDQAATLGCGVLAPGELSLGTGSSLAWRAVTHDPHPDPRGRLCISRHVVPDQHLYEMVAVGSGTTLSWFREALATVPGGDAPSYEQLIAEAAAVPAGSDGLLFYPYPDGATLPEEHPSARGAFLGITAHHRRAHLVRAILEGIAYLYPSLLGILAEEGVAVERLVVIDGESRSATWNQLKADVSGRVLATTGVPEASAVGAAILAGTAAGAFASCEEGILALVVPGPTFTPHPREVTHYAGLHAAWERAAAYVFAAFEARG
jgi:sugar (pentulose or hexulose) kinase